jgi:hypothetical protein
MRRFIHVPLVPFIIICGVAAGGYAAGGYLLYRLLFPGTAEDDMSELSVPVLLCLEMVHREDNYALFADNKRRIMNWCTDYERLFAKGEPQLPPWSEMTEAEKKKTYECLDSLVTRQIPPEPHKTIEDVFDTVARTQIGKETCYGAAKTSKSGK